MTEEEISAASEKTGRRFIMRVKPIAPLPALVERVKSVQQGFLPPQGTEMPSSPSFSPVYHSPSDLRVIGSSFLALADLASRASTLSPQALERKFDEPEVVKMVKNMVWGKGFTVGLQLLQQQAKLDAEEAAKSGTAAAEIKPAIPYNRSAMLKVLFEFLLHHRKGALLNDLCQQLHEANLLPKPAAFHALSTEALRRWAVLRAEEGGASRPSKAVEAPKTDAEKVAMDVKASLLPGDDWTSVPRDGDAEASGGTQLIHLLRISIQWLCIAHKLPPDIWRSGVRIERTDAVSMDAAAGNRQGENYQKLELSAIRIGFNAESLQRRLQYWVAHGVELSVERVLHVYVFKTMCLLAIRGKYHGLAQFLRQVLKLNLGVSAAAVYKSTVQWLVHHDYHAQTNEVWTTMMLSFIPQLKHYLRAIRTGVVDDPKQLASEAVVYQTVKSLCDELLTIYVLQHDDDTMLFRVYATMRTLSLPPPSDLLGIIPPEIVDTLTPQQQLLYIMVHRVMRMTGHVKMDYMMKLFGEIVKVPTMAPVQFKRDGGEGGNKDSASVESGTSNEWPVVGPFLDRIGERIVAEYIRPSWPQKLAKPEFAEQVKKLILHLDSDEAISFTPQASGMDATKKMRRDRLWNLFIELQQKGVVFNVPLLHHLSQSLATKDAVMLSTAPKPKADANVGEDSEESHTVQPSIPIPTLTQQLWKLTVHHGEFDPTTLSYLIMAQFRHYQAGQQQRGLVLRTIRSLEYYRHVLYGTPYEHPPVPRSAALTSFVDVAASGFSSQVALKWLGLDKLDSPLPNLVHMLFEQMDTDWKVILAEEKLRVPVEGEEDVELGRWDDDTELPLNAHSYNYLLQSCLLFTAESMPVKWPQVHAIRSLMADRHFMLNATSVLYLLDTLIEAGELQEARAMLPKVSKPAAASALGEERSRRLVPSQTASGAAAPSSTSTSPAASCSSVDSVPFPAGASAPAVSSPSGKAPAYSPQTDPELFARVLSCMHADGEPIVLTTLVKAYELKYGERLRDRADMQAAAWLREYGSQCGLKLVARGRELVVEIEARTVQPGATSSTPQSAFTAAGTPSPLQPASAPSLWSRIRSWFAGSDEQAASAVAVPPVVSPHAKAQASDHPAVGLQQNSPQPPLAKRESKSEPAGEKSKKLQHRVQQAMKNQQAMKTSPSTASSSPSLQPVAKERAQQSFSGALPQPNKPAAPTTAADGKQKPRRQPMKLPSFSGQKQGGKQQQTTNKSQQHSTNKPQQKKP